MAVKAVLLIASALCFGVNALVTSSRVNLDQAGKCLFVASFVVH